MMGANEKRRCQRLPNRHLVRLFLHGTSRTALGANVPQDHVGAFFRDHDRRCVSVA